MALLLELLWLLVLFVLWLLLAVGVAAAGLFSASYRLLAITVQSIRYNDRILLAPLGLLPSQQLITTDLALSSASDPAFRQYLLGPALVDLGLLVRDIVRMGASWLIGGRRLPDRYRLAHQYLDVVPASFLAPDHGRFARAVMWLGPEGAGLPGGGLLAVADAAGVLLGAAAVLLLVAAAAIVTGLVLLCSYLLGWATAYLLRAIESCSLWVRGITVECLDCQHRVKRPIYECPHPACGVVHRRLLPGGLGILRRYCRCGGRLPTMLAGGKFRLRGRCDHCEALLPDESLVSATAHLVLAAGPSAGKTALFVSALRHLVDRGAARFATDLDKHPYDLRLALSLTDLTQLPPTRPQPDAMVRACPIRLRAGRSSRLVFVYDPAGEHLWRPDDLAGWQFLNLITGMALIVDPFSLPALNGLLDAGARNRVRPCPLPPDEVLAGVVEALHDRHGLAPSWSRHLAVAVVISKGDALADLNEPGHPYEGLAGSPSATGERASTGGTDWLTTRGRLRDIVGGKSVAKKPGSPFPRSPFPRQVCNQAVRSWLVQAAGQRHLVTSLESAFPRIGYFVTGAPPADSDTSPPVAARSGSVLVNDHPAEVLRWLTGMATR